MDAVFERVPKLRSLQHAEDDDVARLRARERRPGKQSRLDARPERPKHPGKRTREGEMHPADAIAYAAAISDPATRTGSGYGTMGSAFGFVPDPRYARIDRRAEANRRDVDQAGLCGVFDLLDEIRGGERLPRELEERFAAELGLDPQRIRVHVGADAARVASELGARAVAIGDDIYFADGAYDPASPAGIELIAHEVAHVAQHQRGGEVAPSEPYVSRPDDAHEQEADRFATSFTPVAPHEGARGEGAGAGQQADPNAGAAGAAGAVTHQTQQSAPGGGGDDRVKVGVGEKVDFTSDTDGAWTASNAHGPKTKSGKTFTWIAPVTADTVTITFTPKGGSAQTTSMTVIAPTDVKFDKTSDITNIKSGTAGVGMVTNITFLPIFVSFAFVSWLEIPGGPSGQTGYFSKHTAPSHHQNPNPLHLGSNNAGPNDTASFFGVGKPWTDGFFEWVIPNHYVVDGESAPGHKFTDIHQTAKLEGDPSAGKMTVTKGTAGGAKSTRSPDGTIAMADPAAASPDPSAADPAAAPASAVGFGARGDGGDTGGDSDTSAGATVTHTTDQPAANNPDGSRTTVGVGEKVAFEADQDGKWSADDAFGAKTATGKKFNWLAPVLANPSVTITFTPKTGAAVPTTMTVVAPSDVELTKASDDTNIPAGTAGAGMITNVRFMPLEVSFRNTQWLEIGGAAAAPQNQSGYFTTHAAPVHQPNATPLRMGWDNAGPTDHAAFAFTKPAKASWADGFFEWIIPNHYVVVGEGGQGHQIVDIHQTATLQADGTFTVAKGTNGASSTRSPDGTVASADPSADPNASPADPNAQAADPPTAMGESAIGIGDGGGAQAGGGSAASHKITHNTQKDAPGNADDTRTKVGVGELVDFGSEFDGTWTASVAIGDKTGTGQTYTWQAPATATTATVSFKPTKGASQQVHFTVVAPNDLAFTKKSEEAFPAGSQGAGMILDVKIKPLDVSFAEAGILEIPGPGTGGTGYFKNRTIPHQPTADPTGIGDDNSVEDQADLTDWPAPYKAGFFEWVIPTNYVVNGESKPGHHIKDIHQTFTMEGGAHAGRTTVTKGTSGAKVTRAIDAQGKVAENDPTADPSPDPTNANPADDAGATAIGSVVPDDAANESPAVGVGDRARAR